MKKLILLMIAAAFSSGAALAEDETEAQIASYDQDGDGLLSKDEVSADQELSARFEELDVNADGKLGEDEIDSGPFDDFDEIGDDPIDN